MFTIYLISPTFRGFVAKAFGSTATIPSSLTDDIFKASLYPTLEVAAASAAAWTGDRTNVEAVILQSKYQFELKSELK